MSAPWLKSQTSGIVSEVIIVVAAVVYYRHHYYHLFPCDCFLFNICGNVPGSHAMLGEKNN